MSEPFELKKENNNSNLSIDLSKEIALSLLQAISASDIKKVLEKYKDLFENDKNWRINAKWKEAGNQQSNAAGAFTELLINSMDACLIKKAKQNEIKDLRGDDVPQSMQDAVKRFYPDIHEGKIEQLDRSHKNKIADETLLVGIKRAIGSKKISHLYYSRFWRGPKTSGF